MRLAAVSGQQLPDPETIRTIIPGITEGGAIILGVLAVLILVLFYFGRILAKRLEIALLELRSTKAEVAETKKVAAAGTYQVQNNHDSNLRDDLDEKHDRVDSALATILTEMQYLRSDVIKRFDGVNQRFAGVDRRLGGIDERLNSRRPVIDTVERQDEDGER